MTDCVTSVGNAWKVTEIQTAILTAGRTDKGPVSFVIHSRAGHDVRGSNQQSGHLRTSNQDSDRGGRNASCRNGRHGNDLRRNLSPVF